MNDPNTLAHAYLALWNDADAASRARRLVDGWTPDARYADPMMAGEGHDGIAAMIAAARAQVPGHLFALRGTPDAHGPFVRFSWTLAPAHGAPIAGGTDIARITGDGRIAEVIGFLDKDVA
ncbi:nuclear transport factor 2 family protein [Xanthomonas sacchari]|uniref:nuclear transport factor 2 family protein n=1 Tax=Xanthomonas sacchari TaxID=56458 RepID=UPI000581F505|nr:nuclear transport factor 2 family protein [Xanthomonas sacchari]AJC48154.1 polyketide cyclase [Xanthomonas sacchari]